MYNFLLLDYFPFGSDVIECKRLENNIFYKKFRKNKFDNFIKSIFLMEFFKNYYFTPKLHKYNSDLELFVSDCGKNLTIRTLPHDWEYQLIKIKFILIKYKILIKDWGLWEVYPFIINNVCVRDNDLYFIDLGNVTYAEPQVIEDYFNKKIYSIKLMLRYGCYYLPYHYIRKICIMTLRKLQRPYNLLLIYLLYSYFTTNQFYFCVL